MSNLSKIGRIAEERIKGVARYGGETARAKNGALEEIETSRLMHR